MAANSSDDLAEKFQDYKKKVKFMQGKPSFTQTTVSDNLSSTSGSGGGDDNDDEDNNQTFVNHSLNMSSSGGAATATTSTSASSSSGGRRKSKKRAVWELLEGYRDKNSKISKPVNYEGILLKRRNWPMKGWHKRYFILIDGTLSYGKSKSDVSFHIHFI
jgi:hypothetical protein